MEEMEPGVGLWVKRAPRSWGSERLEGKPVARGCFCGEEEGTRGEVPADVSRGGRTFRLLPCFQSLPFPRN